jgi:putative glycosyltransferase
MQLSIVTTLYHSAPYIAEFYERAKTAAERFSTDYEMILVNDGSPDNSLDIAISLAEQDARVKVIDLSRNFGHHKAAMTGLRHAQGDLVFHLDVDLEEDPELLDTFLVELKRSQADVVYGVRRKREGRFFERAAAELFYALFNALSAHKIPRNVLVVRLMTRRYVRALVAHRESELDIGGLWTLAGFRQVPVAVDKHRKPTTTYNFARRVVLMIRSITAFSNRPLLWIAALGAVILLVSVIWLAIVLAIVALGGNPPSGYTSLILSVWLLGGLTIFSLGVIAVYLSVIFVETKRRPYTIIRAIHHRPSRSRLDR